MICQSVQLNYSAMSEMTLYVFMNVFSDSFTFRFKHLEEEYRTREVIRDGNLIKASKYGNLE